MRACVCSHMIVCLQTLAGQQAELAVINAQLQAARETNEALAREESALRATIANLNERRFSAEQKTAAAESDAATRAQVGHHIGQSAPHTHVRGHS